MPSQARHAHRGRCWWRCWWRDRGWARGQWWWRRWREAGALAHREELGTAWCIIPEAIATQYEAMLATTSVVRLAVSWIPTHKPATLRLVADGKQGAVGPSPFALNDCIGATHPCFRAAMRSLNRIAHVSILPFVADRDEITTEGFAVSLRSAVGVGRCDHREDPQGREWRGRGCGRVRRRMAARNASIALIAGAERAPVRCRHRCHLRSRYVASAGRLQLRVALHYPPRARAAGVKVERHHRILRIHLNHLHCTRVKSSGEHEHGWSTACCDVRARLGPRRGAASYPIV